MAALAAVKRSPLGPPLRRARRLVRSIWRGLTPVAAHEAQEARRFCSRYEDRSQPIRKYRLAREARLDLLPPELDLARGVIVDLGANVGDWTAAALEIAPRARIIAVEPAPGPRRELDRRFGADPRVSIDPRAVASGAGSADFFVTDHSHNSSMRRPREAIDDHYGGIGAWQVVERIKVVTTTVDELVGEQDVSLLKVDVQGQEWEVLSGARRVLGRTGAVLLEVTLTSHYEGDATFPSLHQRMTELGFDLVGLSEPFRSARGVVLWMDACYAPASAQRVHHHSNARLTASTTSSI